MSSRWNFFDDKGVQQGWVDETSPGRYEIFNNKFVKVGHLDQDPRSGSFDVFVDGTSGRAGHVDRRSGHFQVVTGWKPDGEIIPRGYDRYDIQRNGRYQGYFAKDRDYAAEVIGAGMLAAANVTGTVIAMLIDAVLARRSPSPADMEAERIRAQVAGATTIHVDGFEIKVYDPSSHMMRVQDHIESSKEAALLHDRQDGGWLAFNNGRFVAISPDFGTAVMRIRAKLTGIAWTQDTLIDPVREELERQAALGQRLRAPTRVRVMFDSQRIPMLWGHIRKHYLVPRSDVTKNTYVLHVIPNPGGDLINDGIPYIRVLPPNPADPSLFPAYVVNPESLP